MADLPVREMVLYKHGVGFFVRGGVVTGDAVSLTFRADEINDVLKSLAVFDHAGGQVLGIRYQTPMDKAARLANSSVNLSDANSLRDLFRDLRGRQIDVVVETETGARETLTGRVVGLDGNRQNSDGLEVDSNDMGISLSLLTDDGLRLSLLTADGRVHAIPFEDLRAFSIVDSQAANDLSYFLDTSTREDNRRTVTVQLTDGDHDLFLSYVAPSPTWRVSYRLVAETDEDGTSGTALLQGWGLFDNRLDEDLVDVDLTLVAGQPISFIYELYASRIPQRPTVEDPSRVAPGPMKYTGNIPMVRERESRIARSAKRSESYLSDSSPEAALSPSTSMDAPVMQFMRASAPSPQQSAAAAPAVAEGQATGETFQYHVTTPVSVKRGESALVPILGENVTYRRELLYNGDKLKDHPVAALRFENTSGLTLEHGPVTLVEDGDYKGEAVIPFTRDGNGVYVPYAVELGVRITQERKTRYQTAGVRILQRGMVVQGHFITEVRFSLENSTDEDKTVTIEMNVNGSEEHMFDTPPPIAETPRERRWEVDVAAGEKSEFLVLLRRMDYQRVAYANFGRDKLLSYLNNNWLDRAAFDTVSELIDAYSAIAAGKRLVDERTQERQGIHGQQEQLRANLGALGKSEREAALRDRLLDKLEATQDRLEAIEREIERTLHEREATEARIDEIVAALPES